MLDKEVSYVKKTVSYKKIISNDDTAAELADGMLDSAISTLSAESIT